jgi:hypothetical protein
MTPSERLVSTATDLNVVVDGLGRRIAVRRLTALDTLRLFKAAGPTLAQNEPWLAMASLAMATMEVDGAPIPSPSTESQIESVIARLGEAGLSAVADALATPADRGPADLESTVGNWHGTPS